MTPEERERAERIDRILEFLANNQAEISARQSQFAVQHAQVAEDLARLEKVVESHTRQIESNTQQIAEIGRYLLNLAHIVERTDERLNSVITMVERRFGNGQH
jgi:septal ring factor EnvC (AmiA/AmiB activator)